MLTGVDLDTVVVVDGVVVGVDGRRVIGGLLVGGRGVGGDRGVGRSQGVGGGRGIGRSRGVGGGRGVAVTRGIIGNSQSGDGQYDESLG